MVGPASTATQSRELAGQALTQALRILADSDVCALDLSPGEWINVAWEVVEIGVDAADLQAHLPGVGDDTDAWSSMAAAALTTVQGELAPPKWYQRKALVLFLLNLFAAAASYGSITLGWVQPGRQQLVTIMVVILVQV